MALIIFANVNACNMFYKAGLGAHLEVEFSVLRMFSFLLTCKDMYINQLENDPVTK